MSVDDLDIVCAGIAPREADAVLLVDPYAMLSRAVTRQALKMVARRNAKVVQGTCDLELPELSEFNALERAETRDTISASKSLCVLVGI